MADLVKFIIRFQFRTVIPYLFYAVFRFFTLVNFSWLFYHFCFDQRKKLYENVVF